MYWKAICTRTREVLGPLEAATTEEAKQLFYSTYGEKLLGTSLNVYPADPAEVPLELQLPNSSRHNCLGQRGQAHRPLSYIGPTMHPVWILDAPQGKCIGKALMLICGRCSLVYVEMRREERKEIDGDTSADASNPGGGAEGPAGTVVVSEEDPEGR